MSTPEAPGGETGVSWLPDGFVPWRHDSPFLRRIGPLAAAVEDDRIAGVRVADHHVNARGGLHGGALAAIADVVMGHATAGLADPAPSLVTVSLTVNLTAGAQLDDWLQVTALPRRLGRRLAFADAIIECRSRLIATASGVFTVTGQKGAHG